MDDNIKIIITIITITAVFLTLFILHKLSIFPGPGDFINPDFRFAIQKEGM